VLAARDDNETHLAGVVYAHSNDFWAVGGYNERIEIYGYEDTDLVLRLGRKGLSPRPLDFSTLYHLPHEDEVRFANQDEEVFARAEDKVRGSLPWSHSTLDRGRRAVVVNKVLADTSPWSEADRRASWTYVRLEGPVRYICVERLAT